jgi:hypothetical protein
MRQIWSGWLAVAAAVGVWRCAIDDRTPQQVSPPNQPGAGVVPGGMTPNPMPMGAAGAGTGTAGADNGAAGADNGAAGADNGAAGADNGAAGAGAGNGAAGASSGGAASGMMGAAGTGNAGAGTAGTAGNSAGAAGSGPTGTSGSGATDPFVSGGAPSTSSNCPAFVACGGELAGAWRYSDACAEAPSNLGDLQVLCSTASVRVEPGGAATLTFAGGQVSRQGAPQGDSVITFPSECELPLSCPELGALIGDAGQCSDVNGDCLCRTPASVDWSLQPYTVSGSQLTLQDGRSFDYCVQGDSLIYRETGNAQEPGTFTLQRN